MTRTLQVFALIFAATFLVGCYHRERVTITAYDTISGEPVPAVELRVRYPHFLEPAPRSSTVVTDTAGQATTEIAYFRSVSLHALRPGYELSNFDLAEFTKDESWHGQREVLTPKESADGAWSLRVPMERRKDWYGLLITIPKDFRGPLVISRTAEPIPEHSSEDAVRCIERTLTSTREIIVPRGGYFTMIRYAGGDYLEEDNTTRKGVVIQEVDEFREWNREILFLGTMKDGERFRRQVEYLGPDNRWRISTDAYRDLVEKVSNQPL